MLFTCDRSKKVWEELGLKPTIENVVAQERSGSVILEKLLCSDLEGEARIPIANGVEMIMVAAWYLWWDRRKISHDEKCGTPVRTAMSIRGIVANALAMKPGVKDRKVRWERPAMGVLKLNVDASYHSNEGSGATGAVIRDCTGAFIAGCCYYKQHAMDAPSMDALALLDGLSLADNLGISTLVVESDSLEIVQAILDPSDYRASAAVVTDDCRKLLTAFGRVTVVHCAREGNAAAHGLARASYRGNFSREWRDKPPDFLLPFLVTDMIIV